MKKVVILGVENSHADMLLNYIKKELFPEMEIVGVYSEETEAAEKLSERFGVKVMSSYDEAVGQVDGVVVVARHGNKHYKYAAPYIKSGVPMYIDKPITIDENEALSFMNELKDANVRVTGGSCCRFIDYIQELKQDHLNNAGGKTVGGIVRSPVSMDNAYGGFFFYSQHLVEMVLEIFGRSPKSVQSFKSQDNNTTVVFRYDNFDVTGLFVNENYRYYAGRYFEDGVKADTVIVDGKSPCFVAEFKEFYDLLLGAEQRISYSDFIAPVYVLNAINRSIISGKEEKVTEYEV